MTLHFESISIDFDPGCIDSCLKLINIEAVYIDSKAWAFNSGSELFDFSPEFIAEEIKHINAGLKAINEGLTCFHPGLKCFHPGMKPFLPGMKPFLPEVKSVLSWAFETWQILYR